MLLLLGAIYAFNYLRPIINLYAIYFDLNITGLPALEFFDILNLVFGISLCVFALLLFHYKAFNNLLRTFGGSLFILFNLLNPAHFVIFWGLLSFLLGQAPVWMTLIPEPIFTTYFTTWSLLSISNVLLQAFGIYIAIRILLNKSPQKSLFQYLVFYCWVAVLTSVVLNLQSILTLNYTAGWSALALAPYIIQVITWVAMGVLGIFGLLFLSRWNRNLLDEKTATYGRIALLGYCSMYLLISFSDFAMKSISTLFFVVIFSIILILFIYKLPSLLQFAGKTRKNLSLHEPPSTLP
jgi:hypothetical protein